MKQKRVSFKVAKAIKEAGYNDLCDYGYCVVDDVPILVKTEDEWERCVINNSDMHDFLVCTCQEDDGKDDCTAPTYLDVWLWLWGEKKVAVPITCNKEERWSSYGLFSSIYEDYPDPEEAIVAVIEYLVDNNLLK